MRSALVASVLALGACSVSVVTPDDASVPVDTSSGDAGGPPPGEACAERWMRAPDQHWDVAPVGCRVPNFPQRPAAFDWSSRALGSVCWRVVSPPVSASWIGPTDLETPSSGRLAFAGPDALHAVVRYWTATGLVEEEGPFTMPEPRTRVAEVHDDVLGVALADYGPVVWRTATTYGAGDAEVAHAAFVAGPVDDGGWVSLVARDAGMLVLWWGDASFGVMPGEAIPDTGAPVRLVDGDYGPALVVGDQVRFVLVDGGTFDPPWTLPARPDDAVLVFDALVVRVGRAVSAYDVRTGTVRACPVATADRLVAGPHGSALAIDGSTGSLLSHDVTRGTMTVTAHVVLPPDLDAQIGPLFLYMAGVLVGRDGLAADPTDLVVGPVIADARLSAGGVITAADTGSEGWSFPDSDGVLAVRGDDGVTTIWNYVPRDNPCE